MSDWRHSIVDLTYDDDDAESDEGPLSSLPLATPTPTHPHSLTSMSAPLPQPPSSRPPPSTTRPAPAYATPYPPLPGSMPKATDTASMGRLGLAPNTYVPVPGQSTNGAGDSRAAKRIKTSEGASKPPTPPVKKPTTSRGIPPAAQAATLGKYKLNAWATESRVAVPPPTATSKPSAGNANKAPSVQDINKALKTNGTPMLDGVRTSSPRALHIGRRPGSSSGPVKPAPPTRETPRTSQAPAIRQQQSRDATTYNGASAGMPTRGPGRPYSRPAPGAGHVPSRPNYFAGPAKEQISDDGDSVMSDVSSSADSVPQQPSDKVKSGHAQPGLGPAVAAFHSSTLPKGADVPALPPSTGRKKAMNPFDTAQDNYLVFLKEVKQFSWAQITAEFNHDMPNRPYAALQSRYSTFLNKRDRSQDPSTLILPPRWAAEANIDWNLVRSTSAPSRGPRNNLSTSQAHQPKRQEQAVPRHLPIQPTIEHDYSSGGDSAPRRERSRRTQRVNYTWPKQRGIPGAGIEEEFMEDNYEAFADDFGHARSETSPEDDIPLPSKAIAVDNEPVDVQYDADDAEVGLSLRSRKKPRKNTTEKVPYLSTSQRLSMQSPPAGDWDQLSSRDWQGTLVHVDFSQDEIASVEKAIALTRRTTPTISRHRTKGRQLREHLTTFTEPQILRLIEDLLHRLPCRDRSSIQAFIQDALAGDVAEVPQIQRLAAARPDTEMQSTQKQSTASIIRQRELGLQSRRGWHGASNPLTYQVKNKYMDTMGPAACWTGASSDIHTVAWAPDGEHFAAGSVAVDDPDSMQYNRPNNLLFGSAVDGTIHELAEHYKIREKTETGANSSHATFASQDPKLYTTVSSVAFSNSSPYMYSSGYDGHICIWKTDTEATQPTLAAKLNVKDSIDILSVNRIHSGVIATAAKVNKKAIRVLKIDETEPCNFTKASFHSNKAVARADLRILPSALQFEPTDGGLLLAGFGANLKDTGFDMTGDLCLWDVETQTPYNIHGSNRNVFDVTFNPNRSTMFAAGCVAVGSTVNRGIRSTVRLYDVRDDSKFTCPLEFECKALDMNDVIWCPHDERLIAAGCTDGKVYVWDARWPDDPLRVLSHGSSLMPLQEGIKHEITDTGIRFLSWGENATRLYSGSSDGVVKVWDVTRAEQNTFIKDLITTDSGIMSAAFSPDYSKLVVGEVNGSVNVLEVGRDDTTFKDANRLRYMPYQDDEKDDIQDEDGDITRLAPDSGITEGNYLLQTQQLQVTPMGRLPIQQVVQGVNYDGPFDEGIDAPFLREQALQFQLGLTTSRGPQCDIPACKDNLNKVTSEDVGDSGRSADRIPDELRRQWKAIDTKGAIIPGKSKCTYCARPARPSTTDNSDVVLCERCSFACFRCGSVNPIAPATTTLICDSCPGVWDIGVLGYECVQQPYAHNRRMQLDVPALERWGEEAHADRQDDFDTDHGDEMNALTDYYLSLAIDRPESPPL
ncbi:hypothetical protein J4E93_003779 [Alternaria ventricosa]|uniref:uncharacterized protein n=1 Tax=Alternaria ventricosa TaxID=1187951 RepID=UPI0020C57D29|nr:uncharacterized protein J4E93_003779 [Alternaria ventricosa]KAI4649459.1 hypothetical protein J4E93_003779 [Alternaria ventricosa]